MSRTKKIAILGGGIGGLTVAHQLSKIPGYQIDIYEAKTRIGGLARSDREPIGACATEYCWRVFFGFYDSLLGIMSEIPDGDGVSKDNLTVYKHINVMDPLTLRDKMVGYSKILAGLCSCDERLNDDDRLTWWDALGSTSDSNLFREIGGWLGMDRFRGSYKSVIKIGIEQQIVPSYLDSNYRDFVTTKPTSEALFEPWQRLLESRGVIIHFNSSVKNITTLDDKVTSVSVLTPSGEVNVGADYFVLALPIEVMKNVISASPSVDKTKFGFDNISKLQAGCLHMQLSFQLYFDRPISLGDNNAFLLVESPWDLIVLSYDAIYQTEVCREMPNVKGAWSVAACTAYTPGILFGKTLAECSEEEINQELWAQLSRNKKLQTLVSENNTFQLTPEIVVGWAEMWPTYDPKGGEKYAKNPPSRTTEPKFTNNAGSYALRPSFKTYLSNAYISTAYIKETIDIFSMEAAAIAGKYTANAIDKKSPLPVLRARPAVFAPFRAMDSVAYALGLPNILATLVILLFILVIMAVYRRKIRDT